MKKKLRIVLLALIFLFTKSLSAQCPNRDSLFRRILYLRETDSVPKEQQLTELLSYLKKTASCPGTNDSTQALLLQRIGWLYTYRKDFFNAIQFTRKSIGFVNEQVKRKNPAIDPSILVVCYWNLAEFYDSLNLPAKKWPAIDTCISVSLQLHVQYDYSLEAIKNKATKYFDDGDYYLSIKYAEYGETVIQGNKIRIDSGDGEYYSKRYLEPKINSLIYLNQSAKAEQILDEKIPQYERQKDTVLGGAPYIWYGNASNNKGNALKAINYFKKGFDRNKKLKYNGGCAEALNSIGFTYSSYLHQNKTALQYYFMALKYAAGDEALNILGNIANVYTQANKYDSALVYFQKAFNQIGPGFSDIDLLKNDNAGSPGEMVQYRTGLLLDKAAAWLSKYRFTGNKDALTEAIRIYQLTDRYFDKLKSSQSEIQSKLFWKTNNRRLYEQAIEACYVSDNKEKAVYFFEKSRSVLLDDQIKEQRQMDEATLAKQAQLKKNLLDIEKDLQSNSHSAEEKLVLQQQNISYKQELEILNKNLGSQHSPQLRNYADTATLTPELLRKDILAGKRSILEIFTGDTTVYILSFTPGSSAFIRLNKHLYDSLTTAYISFITNSEKLNSDFAGFVNISHGLYEILFQNIPLQDYESLIISPDGKSFPFEALIMNTNPRQPDYLLNHYAVSYTYSARYLLYEFAAKEKSGSTVLGIAPVKFNTSLGLVDLQGSELSLQHIKKEFSGTTNFVLEEATKNNFLTHFYDYAIIQLYTHAADISKNNDPVIYFADSPLYLSYLIPERRPVTQLVVLSACETASGKLYEGEGIFSFNRGFAALGIPAAVSNFWSVSNQATYRITELFYKYLSMGLPTDVALQKAKLEFISTSPSLQNKLPYFWAGPILTGKVDTIRIDSGFPWKILIPGAVFLLGVGYFIRKIILRKRQTAKTNLSEKI